MKAKKRSGTKAPFNGSVWRYSGEFINRLKDLFITVLNIGANWEIPSKKAGCFASMSLQIVRLPGHIGEGFARDCMIELLLKVWSRHDQMNLDQWDAVRDSLEFLHEDKNADITWRRYKQMRRRMKLAMFQF